MTQNTGNNQIRLIIAGSRNFDSYRLLKKYTELAISGYSPENIIIICGMAKGADLLGKRYADIHDLQCLEYPANWKGFNPS